MSEIQIKALIGAVAISATAFFGAYNDAPIFVHELVPSISEGAVKTIILFVAFVAPAVAVPWRHYTRAWQWISHPSRAWLRCLIYLSVGALVFMSIGIGLSESESGISRAGWSIGGGVAFAVLLFVLSPVVLHDQPVTESPPTVSPEDLYAGPGDMPSELETRLTNDNKTLSERAERAENSLIAKSNEISQLTSTKDHLANQATAAVGERDAAIFERDEWKRKAESFELQEKKRNLRLKTDAAYQTVLRSLEGQPEKSKAWKAYTASIRVLKDLGAVERFRSDNEWRDWELQVSQEIDYLPMRLYGNSGKELNGISPNPEPKFAPLKTFPNRYNDIHNESLNRLMEIVETLTSLRDAKAAEAE